MLTSKIFINIIFYFLRFCKYYLWEKINIFITELLRLNRKHLERQCVVFGYFTLKINSYEIFKIMFLFIENFFITLNITYFRRR